MEDSPNKVLSIDLVGPLPNDEENSYIVVMTDSFTRFTELVPIKNKTSILVANALLQYFGRYGPPEYIRSDHGSEFTSNITKSLCEIMGSSQIFSLPYSPTGNSIVERTNGEVLRHLRAIVYELRNTHWSSIKTGVLHHP